MKCCVCKGKIDTQPGWDQGHNADPVRNGRCCSTCNHVVVIPMRLRRMSPSKFIQLPPEVA